MNNLLLIDVGGTGTKVAVSVNGKIVHRAEFPSFKPKYSDSQTDGLCKALGTWLASLGSELLRPSFTLLGVAGVWDAQERQMYLNDFTDSWMTYVGDYVPRCSVLSDVEIALFASYGSDDGIVLIAGTGSIAVMRTAGNTIQRCGGWGPRIDDAGSGFWIAHQALLAVARELDGRDVPTRLRRPVAAFFQVHVHDSEALSNAIRNAPINNLARLAPAVLQYASEGDVAAMSIRQRAVSALCELVATLSASTTGIQLPVSLYGSLFNNVDFATLVTDMLTSSTSVSTVAVLHDALEQAALRLHGSTGQA